VRWSHVALNCRDQRVTEEFYTRWFGFTRARVVASGAERIVFLRNGDAYLELFPTGADPVANQGDGPVAPGAVRHVAFQTDDIDRLLERMGESAHVSLGPLRFDEVIDGWRTVWLRDPDGVIVEVSQGYRDAAELAARDQPEARQTRS
jgi:glyoxylase I family protein